jgi:hypothetical protein
MLVEQQPNTRYHGRSSPSSSGTTGEPPMPKLPPFFLRANILCLRPAFVLLFSTVAGRPTTLPAIVGELDVDATLLVTFLANPGHVQQAASGALPCLASSRPQPPRRGHSGTEASCSSPTFHAARSTSF